MTRAEAEARLNAANQTIATAVLLLESQRDLMQQFLNETRHADSIMPIVDPTLWMNPERQRAKAVTLPVYQAALALLDAYARGAGEAAAWQKERAR